MTRIVHGAAAVALIALAAACLIGFAGAEPAVQASAIAGGCETFLCMFAIN